MQITDNEDWFTFRMESKARVVELEVYDGNMGDVVVESKLTPATARKLGNALIAAADKVGK